MNSLQLNLSNTIGKRLNSSWAFPLSGIKFTHCGFNLYLLKTDPDKLKRKLDKKLKQIQVLMKKQEEGERLTAEEVGQHIYFIIKF